MSIQASPDRVPPHVVGAAGLRSVLHLAQDLRGAVSLARDHARLLLDGAAAPIDEDQRRSVEVIERQASRLDRLIDELDARCLAGLATLPTPPPPAMGTRTPRPHILVADDEADCREGMTSLLEDRYEVTVARDGIEALDLLATQTFDLAILDYNMPGRSGIEVAEQLGAGTITPPAFMFLSGHPSAAVKVRGLSLGATDFVTKPANPEELLARVARTLGVVQRERSLVAAASSDPLTGLANYRSLARNLELELARAHRYDLPVSLLTIDLDNLKGINDELGHGAGDDAIRLVASVLESGVRRFETVARQGGDELSILLPNATEKDAMKLGERLRREVAGRSIRGRPLSISVGVASRERGDPPTTVRSLLDRSDEALYRSKRAGRNLVSGRPARYIEPAVHRAMSPDDEAPVSPGGPPSPGEPPPGPPSGNPPAPSPGAPPPAEDAS